VVSFKLRPLYPEETAPDTHLIGGWVSPKACVDAVEKRNLAVQPVAISTSYSYIGFNNGWKSNHAPVTMRILEA
jgi:hypothetical protein